MGIDGGILTMSDTQDSYFEIILSECTDDTIHMFCSLYDTKDEIRKAALSGYKGRTIIDLSSVIQGALDLVGEEGYFQQQLMNMDAKKIFMSCKEKLNALEEQKNRYGSVDCEQMFDALWYCNWLLASQFYYNDMNLKGNVALIETQSVYRQYLKRALREVVYDCALQNDNRSRKIEKGQGWVYRFLPGLHPDDEMGRYYAQNVTTSQFKKMQADSEQMRAYWLALFYALTVTAARADEIRRMR